MKTKRLKGLLIGLGACALVGASIGYVGYKSEGFQNWNLHTWYESQNEEINEDENKVLDQNNNSLTSDKLYNMDTIGSLKFSSISTLSVATEGINVSAVFGSDTIEQAKTCDWSIAFKNPSSSWANGKSVSSYVTIVKNGTTCNIKCNEAFGEQIILTAVATADPSKTASITIDYAKKIENISASAFVELDDYYAESHLNVTYGEVGTINSPYRIESAYIYATTKRSNGIDFFTPLNSALMKNWDGTTGVSEELGVSFVDRADIKNYNYSCWTDGADPNNDHTCLVDSSKTYIHENSVDFIAEAAKEISRLNIINDEDIDKFFYVTYTLYNEYDRVSVTCYVEMKNFVTVVDSISINSDGIVF